MKKKLLVGQVKKLQRSNPRHVYWFFSVIILMMIGVFSWWLMSHTFQWQSGQFVMRSYLWSDFAAHLPLIRSFSLGSNWPPEYPQFANEPIRYHFLFYLLVGLLEKAGLNMGLALNIPSTIGLTAMLFLIYLITGELFMNSSNKLDGGSRVWGKIVAGWLAVVLVLFNGTLTYVDYFRLKGFTLKAWLEIPQQAKFINFGPWNGDSISAFWHWNVLTNQRHLAFSFALVLLIFLTLIRAQRLSDCSPRRQVRVGMVIAWCFLFLPFLNYASFAIGVFMLGGWLLMSGRSSLRWWLPVILSMGCALPGLIYFSGAGGQIFFKPGFLASSKQLSSVLYYWWRNMGLYLPLWLMLLIVTRGLVRRLLLLVTTLFIIANLFQLSPDMINNHKLINFFQMGLVIVLSIKMSEGWFLQGRLLKLIRRAIILLIIIPLTLSGVLDASAVIRDHAVMIEDPGVTEQGQWLIQQVPAEAVVVTNQYIYNPINLVGRKTYLDYGYFAWSMGYQDHNRRARLSSIFAQDIDERDWCQFMQSEQIDYLYLTPDSGDLAEYQPELSWVLTQNKPTLIDPAGNSLYSVKWICSGNLQSL